MEEMQKKLEEAEQRVQSLEEEKDKKREKKKKNEQNKESRYQKKYPKSQWTHREHRCTTYFGPTKSKTSCFERDQRRCGQEQWQQT